MRIRIGDMWFRPKKGYPIAVELDERDKELIRDMGDATRYALFAEDETMSTEERMAWMAKKEE